MNERAHCLFCRIVDGEIPATAAYRDEEVVAIADVNPQAPVHLLVMPVRHVANLPAFVRDEPPQSVGKLFAVAARLGAERGGESFRVVVNTGPGGGQTVEHLHVHVLAGRQMHWPPG